MKFWSLLIVALMLGSLGGCVSNYNAKDYTPSLQDEGDGIHDGLAKRIDANEKRLNNSIEQMGYHFLNTNAQYAPYDTVGSSFNRDLSTLEQTIDWHFLNHEWSEYDWD